MGRYAQSEVVVDAPHPLALRVTANNVAAARTCEVNNCVMAVSASVLFGPGTLVSFGATRAFIKRPNSEETWRYVLPKRVIDEIRKFDETGEFEPGLYELPVCRPSQRLDVPRPTKNPGSTGRTQRNRTHHRQPLRVASRPTATTVAV